MVVGRPKGYRLNRAALEDLLLARGLSMTAAAERSGIALTTLSGLASGMHRASTTVVKQIADGIECAPATLFPEVSGRFAELDPALEAVG